MKPKATGHRFIAPIRRLFPRQAPATPRLFVTQPRGDSDVEDDSVDAKCSRGMLLGEAFAEMASGGSMPEADPVDFSIAILVGGASRRMGVDKATQLLAGKPLVQHVIDAMRPLSTDLFLVGKDIEAYRRFGLPVTCDLHTPRSSLVGIHTAVASARSDKCLVVSCDMPFAEAEAACALVELSPGFEAVVPLGPAGMEPLFALYNRSCLDTMEDCIKRGEFKILEVLSRLKLRRVTATEMGSARDRGTTFFNVNTPDDLRRAEVMLAGAGEDQRAVAAVEGKPPIVCFVGHKNSGKTTFLETLVQHISSRGFRVACIKHDVHGFRIDHEGTDTWRLARAGASEVIISAPDRYAAIAKVAREMDLEELRDKVDGSADIILAEGYKSSAADKIEVRGRDCTGGLTCDEGDLLAVISHSDLPGVSMPVFGHGETAAVSRFIFDRYGMVANGAGPEQ